MYSEVGPRYTITTDLAKQASSCCATTGTLHATIALYTHTCMCRLYILHTLTMLPTRISSGHQISYHDVYQYQKFILHKGISNALYMQAVSWSSPYQMLGLVARHYELCRIMACCVMELHDSRWNWDSDLWIQRGTDWEPDTLLLLLMVRVQTLVQMLL
jgi:hypothetical protein